MRNLLRIGAMLITTGLLAALAAGCASTPLRTEASTSGIRAAEEVGAAGVPRAALHLQLAKEELERAKRMAKDGEKAQAESMLTRAEADAELALNLSREHNQKIEAQAALEKVIELRNANQ